MRVDSHHRAFAAGDLRSVLQHHRMDAAVWAPGIAEIACHERVFCRLSGWRPRQNLTGRPAISRAISIIWCQASVPPRLMRGGDWPVADLAGGYDR
jgi:predicted TIM-barrel fold metal-dependent hydrolase